MHDAVLRLKITLLDTEPPIWRRVEVPAAMTLKDLHAVIQAAMGWENAHLYQFHVGRETIDGPGTGDGWGERRSISAGRVRLDDLAQRRVKRFDYVYDMGDSWEHRIQIEKVLPADSGARYPRLLDGAMCCPPDPGFGAFLEAMSDAAHAEHEDVLEWYGGPFDPASFDIERLRKSVEQIARRRKRASAKRAQ
jgi:Plasmid pRiA4b ORF-3-like protein